MIRTFYRSLVLSLLCLGCADPDRDGVAGKRDCAPNDPTIRPGMEEVCDGVDNDCDGYIDEGVSIVAYWDRDLDGFGDPAHARRVCSMPEDGTDRAGDCNDLDPTAHPDAEETCDGQDNDCDGEVDEGVTSTFFEDADGDGQGAPGSSVQGCEAGNGASSNEDDCDDTNALVYLDAPEQCDELDNDCDGEKDEDLPLIRQWADTDGDGHGDPDAPVLACGPTSGVADNPGDCDDTDAAIGPHAEEIRGNTVDEDCDGYLSELAVPDEFETLESALDAATDGDVVQLGFGTFTGSFDLSGANVTLAGEGCGATTLYGDASGTVLTMDGGTLEGLTLSGGRNDYGGGLRVEGDLQVSGLCVRQNTATEAGGGIAVLAGHLQLQDAVISSNSAYNGAGIAVFEGASLSGVRTHILTNQATKYGAGLYQEDASVRLENTTFAENHSQYGGGGFYIENLGPETDSSTGEVVDEHAGDSTLELQFVTVHDNWARVSGQGGFNNRGSLQMADIIASGHQAAESYSPQVFYSYGTAEVSYTRMFYWDNRGTDLRQGYQLEATRLNPDLFQADRSAPEEEKDYRLGPGSPLIGMGDSGLSNPDGTPANPGAFGGPNADPSFDELYARDSDLDGMVDGFEIRFELNRWIDDGSDDLDSDGLTHLQEFQAGTSPILADTDEDGALDGTEVSEGTDPMDPRDQQPFCHINGPKFVLPGQEVHLDGQRSADPNGDSLAFTWILDAPIGSAVSTLEHDEPHKASWIPDVVGTWELEFIVSDGKVDTLCQWAVESLDAIVIPDEYATIQAALDDATTGDTLAIRPGTYIETLDPAGIDVRIIGLGAAEDVLIDANQAGSVLSLLNNETVELAQLTLMGGNSEQGGGIFMGTGARLHTSFVVVRNNRATSCGGGLFSKGFSVDLNDTLISHNQAEECGGGISLGNSPFTATRLGVFHNQAVEEGGGIHIAGGSVQSIQNAWMSENSAATGSAVYRDTSGYSPLEMSQVAVYANHGAGPAIAIEDGPVNLLSSLIAYNATDTTLYRHEDAFLFPLFNDAWANNGVLYAPAPDHPGDLGYNLYENPKVGRWSNDTQTSNDLLSPKSDSPLVDAGFAWHLDIDGSPADIGPWGGPDAPSTSPLSQLDSDGDGMDNLWETFGGLDPHRADDSEDPDEDGLSNAHEYQWSTGPNTADSDGDGVNDHDEVNAGGDPTNPLDNQPAADCGPDLRGRTGTTIALDGSGSSDPNGDSLSYQWAVQSVPASSTADSTTLSNATLSVASFVPDVRGIYTFSLQVHDGKSSSRIDTVSLEVYGDLKVPSEYATLALASAELIEDDTIIIEAGTVVGSIDRPGLSFSVQGEGVDVSEWVATPGHPALVIESGESVTVSDLTLSNGTGTRGGAIDCFSSSSATALTTLTVERVLFEQNVAEYGGGLYLYNCVATLNSVDFIDNGSGISGGAVYSDAADLTYTGGTLQGNHAGSTGGGIYVRHSTATLRNLVAIDNASGASGGGIYQYGGDVDVGFSTFAANTGTGATIFAQSAVSTNTHHTILMDSNQYGLYVSTSTTVASSHNLFFGNKSAASLPSSLSNTSDHVLGDPKFVEYDITSLYTYDLRLRWDSPAIDAGDSTWSDPDGTVVDIGAFAGPDAPADFDAGYEDTDSDGMADLWEDRGGLNSGIDDSTDDLDGDGLTNEEEFLAGTHPDTADSDADGVDDADEVDDGTDPAEPGEYRPTANAGMDTMVTVSTTATLNGSGSTDPNSDSLTYQWTFYAVPGRSTLTDTDLTNATSSIASFIPDTPGVFEVQLVVSDGTSFSMPDRVEIQTPGDLQVPEDYETVEDAMMALTSGYAIDIGPGDFPTQLELDGKDVTLQGAGRDQTFLSGFGSKPIISLSDGEELVLQDLSLTDGNAPFGGALYLAYSDAHLERVDLIDNTAVNGGAVYAKYSSFTVENAQFTNNTVHYNGGAVFLYNGDAEVSQTLFAGNTSLTNDGGALYVLSGDVALMNTILAENSAIKGGAIYLTGSSSSPSSLALDHITATDNEALYGGFVRSVYSEIDVLDSIISHTKAGYAFHASASATTTYTQSHSLVYSNASSHYYNLTDPTGTNGNINTDPSFTDLSNDGDWTNDDWSLSSGSAAEDAGDSSRSETDVDGSAPDMGAFGGPLGDWSP